MGNKVKVMLRCAVARTVKGSNPHQCLWIHDLQVCGSKKASCCADLPFQSAGVTPEVNLRITQVTKHAIKGSTLALRPRADVTRSPK